MALVIAVIRPKVQSANGVGTPPPNGPPSPPPPPPPPPSPGGCGPQMTYKMEIKITK
jgi:hypothetical protein